MHEGIDQRDAAMRLMVVVLRRPVRPVRLHNVDRGVVEQRRQRILLRLSECDEIDERLDQRADRPLRIEGTIGGRLDRAPSAPHLASRR
jgi:hypothetical protein